MVVLYQVILKVFFAGSISVGYFKLLVLYQVVPPLSAWVRCEIMFAFGRGFFILNWTCFMLRSKRRHSLNLSAALIYFCVPMSGYGPYKRGSRATGVKTLTRAAGKFGIFLIYIILNTLSPDWILNISYWLWMTVGLFFLWLIISGIVDTLGGLCTIILGIHVDDHFCNVPILADSPRDFWSHRWNMLVKKYNHECIFQPLRELGASSALSALGVVFSSAVAHDYFVLVGDGCAFFI